MFPLPAPPFCGVVLVLVVNPFFREDVVCVLSFGASSLPPFSEGMLVQRGWVVILSLSVAFAFADRGGEEGCAGMAMDFNRISG